MVPFGLALVGAIAFSLVQYRKEVTTPLASSRITYLLIGLSIVTPYLLTNISQDLSKYPIDHLGNLFNALIISYAILKYNLMDIRVVIQRSLPYSALTVVLTAAFLMVLYGLQNIFPVSSGYSGPVVAAALALMMAITFTPLRNLTQERMDRLFFRSTYEFRQRLADFRASLSNALDLERLSRDMLDVLLQGLHAQWATLLILDGTTGEFQARFSAGEIWGETSLDLMLHRDSPLVTLMVEEKQALRVQYLDTFPEGAGLWESEMNSLRALGVNLLCPMLSRGTFTGILALGEKRRGTDYTEEEVDLLLTMASGAALAVDNARMLDSLRQQQQRAEQLLAQVVQAQEQERERMTVELHDSVAQWLVRASYQAQICNALLAQRNDANLREDLEALEDAVDESLRELRMVMAGLRPPSLDELGLNHALSKAAETLEKENIECFFETEGSQIRLDPSMEITVFRIVQEALNNVRRHASYQAQICNALLAQRNDANLREDLEALEDAVDESLRELRMVMAGLRPPSLDELGLNHALSKAAETLEKENIECFFETEGSQIRLDPSMEITVFRIVQEALNNVRRHAKATSSQSNWF